ncbi:MAG: LysE family translocator [Planktomarina sp.]|jgi:threonine/homoserine/homoserine lactone efflux protein|nr:LysE family translocator [Planktomarina sp.]|tara:strand:- start:1853 stop:2452 length:600 start_codon:yes stop_codon:yes gene_type:complete
MPVEIIALIIFAVSQIGTPGPANMALLATGAGYGLRRALPFVAGVVVGKQLIIWPLGFGLMQLADSWPVVFSVMKYISAAYIIYLAWRVANMRLKVNKSVGSPPGFVAGLVVHPLNPKAWGMITTAFTSFVIAGAGTFAATFSVAVVLLSCQMLLHPLWAGAGQLIANTIQGTRAERVVFVTLALLTIVTVFYALFGVL